MRDVSATETAIIYGLEPLWGAGFAWFLLGERWGTIGWIGAALVLGKFYFFSFTYIPILTRLCVVVSHISDIFVLDAKLQLYLRLIIGSCKFYYTPFKNENPNRKEQEKQQQKSRTQYVPVSCSV